MAVWLKTDLTMSRLISVVGMCVSSMVFHETRNSFGLPVECAPSAVEFSPPAMR